MTIEDLLIKMVGDSPSIALAFYVLFCVNKNLGRLVDSVDKLEKRVERLEEIILKEATK